ncbi:MAG TPA: FecR domain-containing protein [Vicinamibacterales bacterium]|nr:FecR domain-containing protein [Vicinamibacterales bacterium]
MSSQHDDYLWNRTGTPDPEVVRLERILGELKHQGALPPLPVRREAGHRHALWGSRRILRTVMALSAAAVITIVAGAAWFTLVQPRIGWAVETIAGLPAIDGRTVAGSARLGIGGWLVTDAAARARVSVGQIGRVEVEPNTRLQLVEARGREHRMALSRGTIHARIWAPPKFFFVNTPSAVAIDLGCAYTLQVDETGAGLVRVTHGWVGFEHEGRESFIPEQAVCATRPGVGPGTPRYEDAPEGYAPALALLDFGAPDDNGRASALNLVLSRARPRDALTLWHLLRRGSRAERSKVYDRMAALVPPPAEVSREAVLAGDRRAIDLWWNALDLQSTTWWRLWKRQW